MPLSLSLIDRFLKGRADRISSMINKDLLAGMRIEMKSLGVYVPKPAAEDVPASSTAPTPAPPTPAAAASTEVEVSTTPAVPTTTAAGASPMKNDA